MKATAAPAIPEPAGHPGAAPAATPAHWRWLGGLIPAPRMAIVLLLGAVPLLAGGPVWFLWYNLAAAAAVLLDLLLDLRPGRLRATRSVEQILAAGRRYIARVEVRCDAGRPLHLQVLDDFPLEVEAPARPLHLDLRPPGRAEAAYQFTPTRRGDCILGPLRGRYLSPMGLWYWRVTWPVTHTCRVYPTLPLAAGWELMLRARRTPGAGMRRSRAPGLGTELESLRDYFPGDPYRTINWPAVARRGRLTVNQYQVDQSQQVMLALDCGRLMAPHARGVPLLEHALQAGLLLGWVAGARGDRVGLLRFSSTVERYVPPARGNTAMPVLLAATYDAAPVMAESDYAGAFAYLQRRQRRRSLICILTTLAEPPAARELVRQAGALASRHLVVVVSQQDPELYRLARLSPDTAAGAYRKAAALEWLAQRAETEAYLRRAGVVVVDAPPERISVDLVNRYLELKEQGRL